MRRLSISLAFLVLAACGSKSGSNNPAIASSVPTPVAPQPVVVPPAPAPTPTPTPSPAPTYNCANHPLTGRTLRNALGWQLTLNTDCSMSFEDSAHISYGSWTPNPDMSAVAVHPDNANIIDYPVNLSPNGSYVCLPAGSPQTCTNYGFAGKVLVQLDGNSFMVLQ